MKSSITRALLIGAGVAAAVALGATSASAVTTTYTVAAGSAATGKTVPITGTTTGTTPQVNFVDTTAGIALTCDSSVATGSTITGTGLSGTKIGKITGTKAKFTNCKGPFGLAFVVTGKSTWYINATGSTASGVTNGSITGANAHVADGTSCVFDVTGTVAATYKNGTSATALSALTLPGTTSGLTLSNVSGSTCSLAGIKSGDKASFKAVYSIKANTAAYNPVTITSN